jgi:nucleoid DNA-binding protein
MGTLLPESNEKDGTMRKQHWLALGGLVGSIAVGLGLAGSARSQLPPPPPRSLNTELVRTTGLEEAQVDKLLKALGPEISKQLEAGRQVSLQGLGTFRVVQLEASRNLDAGRPVMEPARNIVEFLPDAAMERAASAPGAVPAVYVPAFQYVPLPNQTPSTRVPPGRTPSTRVR